MHKKMPNLLTKHFTLALIAITALAMPILGMNGPEPEQEAMLLRNRFNEAAEAYFKAASQSRQYVAAAEKLQQIFREVTGFKQRYSNRLSPYFLNSIINPDIASDYNYKSLLLKAVDSSDTNMVSFLLAHGANPNFRTSRGYGKVTALGVAALVAAKTSTHEANYFERMNKIIEIIQILLDAKADPNSGVLVDYHENTPLYILLSPKDSSFGKNILTPNFEKAIRLLLSYGANPSIKNFQGHTAYHYLEEYPGTAHLIKILHDAETKKQSAEPEYCNPQPTQQQPIREQTLLPDFRPGATPRQVLGLPNTASSNDALHAYRKLSLIYHPDKFNVNKALLAERGIYTVEQAQDAFTKINNAWERLK